MSVVIKEPWTLLVDCDVMVYRCGFAADSQKRRELQEAAGREFTKEEAREALLGEDYEGWALGNVRTVMDSLMLTFPNFTGMKSYLTGDGNFREHLATIRPYKGNRSIAGKPRYYEEIRSYLQDVWQAEVVTGMEADDAIGIAQFTNKDKSTCIVAVDKDFLLIPGHHFNWVKNEYFYTTYKEANLNFLRQMIEGDASDNIQGVPGRGPKFVDSLFAKTNSDFDKAMEVVKSEYQLSYGENWVDAFNENAALLWILRDTQHGCPYRLLDDG